MHLLDFILDAGIILTALILLILIKSKPLELPQKLLIVFFGFILSYFLHAYSIAEEVKYLYTFTFAFNCAAGVFLGPLLFVYIKSLVEDNKGLLQKNWFHFLPGVFNVIFLGIPIILSILIGRFIFDYLEYFNEYNTFLYSLFIAHLSFYSCLALRLFHQYMNAMKSNFSNFTKNDFEWIYRLLIGFILVSLAYLGVICYELFIEEADWETNYISLVLTIILVTYLGYYGLNQSKILLPDFLLKEQQQLTKESKKPNFLSTATAEELEHFQSQLDKCLKVDKLYLDEDLTLYKLAQQIPTTDKKLSIYINQHLSTNFYDLINQFRVNAVKESLKDDILKKYSIVGLAKECGFKSKSSFYRVFKKHAGLSPVEYLKQISE